MNETPGSILAKLFADRDAGKDISKVKEDFKKATQKYFGNALANFSFEIEEKKSNKPLKPTPKAGG